MYRTLASPLKPLNFEDNLLVTFLKQICCEVGEPFLYDLSAKIVAHCFLGMANGSVQSGRKYSVLLREWREI